MTLNDLTIEIFADGANKTRMIELSQNPLIKGFTTNPELIRKAGVRDYCSFALDLTSSIPDRPISFAVLSDDFDEMEAQAHEIASWGQNIYVKIPVTNTRGQSSCNLLTRLTGDGLRVNVTALMTLQQVETVSRSLQDGPSCYVSIFAGRMADTGHNPVPIITQAAEIVRARLHQKLIWASARELFNIFQADASGCHAITVTDDIIKKFDLVGKKLQDYSLETVTMFHQAAVRSAYFIGKDSDYR